MGIAFLVIAILVAIRGRRSIVPVSAVSAIFFAFAVICPQYLKYVYIFWMRLAFVLGWVNTRLILCILFYLVFTPIGLAMRLFGADLLDKKIDKNKASYWHKKERKDFVPAEYERQY
jgi:hypothetical protein